VEATHLHPTSHVSGGVAPMGRRPKRRTTPRSTAEEVAASGRHDEVTVGLDLRLPRRARLVGTENRALTPPAFSGLAVLADEQVVSARAARADGASHPSVVQKFELPLERGLVRHEKQSTIAVLGIGGRLLERDPDGPTKTRSHLPGRSRRFRRTISL
jgi:hypothetical protein